MQHWEELARYERSGFGIIVDKTWEDTQLRDCFDETCYNIAEMEQKVNDYDLDWFILRVRVIVEELELASEYLGGCLYERAKDVLTDGTAEDLIAEALTEAKFKVYRLHKRFAALSEMVDSE